MTMTIRDQIAGLTSPVARELLTGLADEIEQMIMVPDSWLPEKFQGSKAGGRTLSQLREMDAKFTKDRMENENHKKEKARRVKLYSQQIEESGTIEYEPFVNAPKKKKSLF